MKNKPENISQEDWDAVDIPELTDEQIASMRPAAEVLPDVVAAYKRSRGRPKLDNPKQPINIRLDPEILDYFKAQGKKWQTNINAVLLDYVKSH